MLMVMTYYSDHFIIHTNIEILHCITETNVIFICQLYINFKNLQPRNFFFMCGLQCTTFF